MPGPNIVYECPECIRKFYSPSISSGNTFGTTFWSDGYIKAPMLPDYPPFVCCPQCHTGLWLDTLKEIDEIEPWEFVKHTKYRSPGLRLLQKELKRDDLKYENLRWLLLRIIHTSNVHSDHSSRPISKAAKTAMVRFIEIILKPINTEDHIFYVEFCREMSEFDKAKELIMKQNFIDRKYKIYYDHQLKWIEEENPFPMKYEFTNG